MSAFTVKQMQWAFCTIATNAHDAKQLCSDAIANPGDLEAQAVLLGGVEALINQIGWIADHHDDEANFGGAENWMLPPVYHCATEGES